jgi:uncharacterized protein
MSTTLNNQLATTINPKPPQSRGLAARGLDGIMDLVKPHVETAQAMWQKGDDYYVGGNETAQDYGMAFYWFTKAAELGDDIAQYMIGIMYSNGEGVLQDDRKAYEWFLKSAEQGLADAQLIIGHSFEYGETVVSDFEKAAYWYSKAAEQDHEIAKKALASINQQTTSNTSNTSKNFLSQIVPLKKMGYYKLPSGVTLSSSQLREATKRQLQRFTNTLSETAEEMYQKGIDCDYGRNNATQDYVQAVYWYRKAAEQGHVVSQDTLGVMYGRGEPVEKDYVQALYWYRKSVKQGHAQSQYSLGLYYAYGHGVAQDDVQAVHWYREAAEQGNAGGQKQLGFMYEKGRGVAQDDVQAVHWYRKAAEQGISDAKESLQKLEQKIKDKQ